MVFRGSGGCIKSMLITSLAAITAELTTPTQQNELYIHVT